MREEKIVQRPAVVVVSVTCNKCGKCFKEKMATETHTIRLSGSYGSTFPEDLQVLEFEVCGPCMKGWVNTFKHEPDLVWKG